MMYQKFYVYETIKVGQVLPDLYLTLLFMKKSVYELQKIINS